MGDSDALNLDKIVHYKIQNNVLPGTRKQLPFFKLMTQAGIKSITSTRLKGVSVY